MQLKGRWSDDRARGGFADSESTGSLGLTGKIEERVAGRKPIRKSMKRLACVRMVASGFSKLEGREEFSLAITVSRRRWTCGARTDFGWVLLFQTKR
jgi:hypothetical protein